MVPFAGYLLPVQYAGVIAEAKAVRVGVGIFDVSHMARLRFRGSRAGEMMEWLTTNDVAELGDRRGCYNLLPNDRGGCVDDIILYRIAQDEFRMVVNAANHAKDVAWLKDHNDFGVEMEDSTERTAMIAVQGPKARELVAGLAEDSAGIRSAPLFGILETRIAGIPCIAPCSGYTGEDGFELICAAEDGVRLWNALLAGGATPCGLGSRDALRVEAGLPLYGHELGDDISPIAAGLGWVIGKEKRFIGSEHVSRARAEGTPTRLLGVKMAGKRLPAPQMRVHVGGRDVGEVSSGVFSPALDCGIGFAFVESGLKTGTPCEVDVRGKMEPATLVGKRFLKRDAKGAENAG